MPQGSLKDSLMVVLDPDVAAIFPTSEAVNDSLRVLAAALQNLPNVIILKKYFFFFFGGGGGGGGGEKKKKKKKNVSVVLENTEPNPKRRW